MSSPKSDASSQRTALITGGAGFIGSHTCLELLAKGWNVISLDNYANSSPEALRRVEELAGRRLVEVRGDLRERSLLDRVFEQHDVDAVVHFAGLKAVGESTEIPLDYYSNNLHGSQVLLQAMQAAGVRSIVFSSSCTVYGDPGDPPLAEDRPLSGSNPYGRTKLFIEEMLRDLAASEPGWHMALLRYFNPVGAHPSGRIGEDPRGTPNNLMPYIMQVAVGRRESLSVFGGDYSTPDGTGVRDYIHVVDLALGHLAALDHLERIDGWRSYNLGTGQGSSVLEVVAAASKAVGRELPYRIVDRRPGDSAAVWADPARAVSELGWRATRDIDEMCRDSWNWQSQNPEGYGE